MKNLSIVVMLCFGILMSTQAVQAENHPGKKFQRGAINMLTSPLEFPKQFKSEFVKAKNPKEQVVWSLSGLVKGTAYSFKRLGAGLWDALTFNLEIPADDAAVIDPEYVHDYEWIKRLEDPDRKVFLGWTDIHPPDKDFQR